MKGGGEGTPAKGFMTWRLNWSKTDGWAWRRTTVGAGGRDFREVKKHTRYRLQKQQKHTGDIR